MTTASGNLQGRTTRGWVGFFVVAALALLVRCRFSCVRTA